MRPPVLKEARRSHLQPCPRCGEANGITAIACWKCDLQLIPDHLLEPRHGASRTPPADVPLVDAEVPAEMLEQLRAARHDGPHTLPPITTTPDMGTANDPHFGSAWAVPQFRLLWIAVGLALAAALLAWLVPRAPIERPAMQTRVTSTVAIPAPATRADTTPKAAVVPPPAAVAPARAAPEPVTALAVVATPATPPAPHAALAPTGARGAAAPTRASAERPLPAPL